MRAFIKAHPYLSCAGLALVTNTACGLALAGAKCSEFFAGFLGLAFFTTLPSMGVTAIDKYVHQNLIDNKPLQYGLTALESVELWSRIAGKLKSPFNKEVSEFYNNLITSDLSDEGSIAAKVTTASSLIQSLGFKYILDLADEQIEIENDQSLFGEDNLQDGFEAEICM